MGATPIVSSPVRDTSSHPAGRSKVRVAKVTVAGPRGPIPFGWAVGSLPVVITPEPGPGGEVQPGGAGTHTDEDGAGRPDPADLPMAPAAGHGPLDAGPGQPVGRSGGGQVGQLGTHAVVGQRHVSLRR